MFTEFQRVRGCVGWCAESLVSVSVGTGAPLGRSLGPCPLAPCRPSAESLCLLLCSVHMPMDVSISLRCKTASPARRSATFHDRAAPCMCAPFAGLHGGGRGKEGRLACLRARLTSSVQPAQSDAARRCQGAALSLTLWGAVASHTGPLARTGVRGAPPGAGFPVRARCPQRYRIKCAPSRRRFRHSPLLILHHHRPSSSVTANHRSQLNPFCQNPNLLLLQPPLAGSF